MPRWYAGGGISVSQLERAPLLMFFVVQHAYVERCNIKIALSERATTALIEARRRMRAGQPEGHSLVDELLRERREEFLREMMQAAPLSNLEIEALEAGGVDLVKNPDGDDGEPSAQEELARFLIECLSVEEFQNELKLTNLALQALVKDRGAYSFDEFGPTLFPLFQIERGSLLPGFDRVGPAIPKDLHPYLVSRWWSLPNRELQDEDDRGQLISPRDWLLSGKDSETVLQAARYL